MDRNECVASEEALDGGPRIAVIGCGGAGNNVVDSMYDRCPGNIRTIALNTDGDKLDGIRAHKKALLGESLTNGLGTKGDPCVGEECARSASQAIRRMVSEFDIVYVVAAMGGGAGTGIAPVVAEMVSDMDKVLTPIAIHPFSFERDRVDKAREGIARLKAIANTVILDNDRLLDTKADVTLDQAFGHMNRGIMDMVLECSRTCTHIHEDRFPRKEATMVQMHPVIDIGTPRYETPVAH